MTDLAYPAVASKLENIDREMVLPLLLGNGFMLFENVLYGLADRLLNGYEGGYWEIFDITENGDLQSVFFVLTEAATYEVESLGFQCTVSTTARATGAALTLMTLSQLSFALVNRGNEGAAQKASNAYHKLREFALYGDFFTEQEKADIAVITD